MALNNHDEARVREYLLGQLNDEEQHKIEERLMIEDDLFEELEISKGELVEDYYSGELSQKERQWFEQHFLASPEGKQKYSFTVALGHLNNADRKPSRPGLLDLIRSLLEVRPWTTAAVSTALLVVVGLIVIPRSWQSPSFASIQLTSSSATRDEGPQPTSVQLSNVDELRIFLALPPSAPAAVSYRAELHDSRGIKPVQVKSFDSRTVTIVIPAKSVPPGEYVVQLSAVMVDGSEQRIPGSYYFNVE